MKNKLVFKLLIGAVIVSLIFVFIFGIYSYLKRSFALENGIVIESFSDVDKQTLCTYFDIEENDNLTIESFEYIQGFRDSCIRLFTKTNIDIERAKTLINYKESDTNYYLDGFDLDIDKSYTKCEQLVNKFDLHKFAFVFYYQEKVSIMFYSTRGDNAIQNYIDMQVSSGNFKEK